MTIGQLAKRAGVKTSTLRFYENEGLLRPDERSQSGYRLYSSEAEQTLRFIQRAQRLGFALEDIRRFLERTQAGQLHENEIIATAEQRFFAIEKQVTQWLVLRHEMGLFLQDMHQRSVEGEMPPANSLFEQLVERVCADPQAKPLETTLEWLLQETGCQFTSAEGRQLIERLSDQHIHIWQVNEAYHILLVTQDATVEEALRKLTQLESECEVHEQPPPELARTEEGFLLVCRGENAFLYARLFLSISS